MATEEQAREVKRRHSAGLLQQPGVSGVGVERDEHGSYFIAIHLADPGAASGLPTELDGCTVRFIDSGAFRKLKN